MGSIAVRLLSEAKKVVDEIPNLCEPGHIFTLECMYERWVASRRCSWCHEVLLFGLFRFRPRVRAFFSGLAGMIRISSRGWSHESEPVWVASVTTIEWIVGCVYHIFHQSWYLIARNPFHCSVKRHVKRTTRQCNGFYDFYDCCTSTINLDRGD